MVYNECRPAKSLHELDLEISDGNIQSHFKFSFRAIPRIKNKVSIEINTLCSIKRSSPFRWNWWCFLHWSTKTTSPGTVPGAWSASPAKTTFCLSCIPLSIGTSNTWGRYWGNEWDQILTQLGSIKKRFSTFFSWTTFFPPHWVQRSLALMTAPDPSHWGHRTCICWIMPGPIWRVTSLIPAPSQESQVVFALGFLLQKNICLTRM